MEWVLLTLVAALPACICVYSIAILKLLSAIGSRLDCILEILESVRDALHAEEGGDEN